MTNLIIKDYKQLNNVVKSIANNNVIEWHEQVFITEFFNKYSIIEKYKFLKNIDPDYLHLLLKYITTCTENLNNKQLSNIDILECYKNEKDKTLVAMKERHHICKDLNAKISELGEMTKNIKNSNNKVDETQLYNRLHNHYIDQLNRESNTMHKLIDKSRDMEENYQFYSNNLFAKLQKLNLSFLDAIQTIR